MKVYTTRGEAIEREIVDPIEADGESHGEAVDARATYCIDEIADKVIMEVPGGYAAATTEDEFWEIVVRHGAVSSGTEITRSYLIYDLYRTWWLIAADGTVLSVDSEEDDCVDDEEGETLQPMWIVTDRAAVCWTRDAATALREYGRYIEHMMSDGGARADSEPWAQEVARARADALALEADSSGDDRTIYAPAMNGKALVYAEVVK